MTAIAIKGAKAGSSESRKPSIAKDSVASTSTTKMLYGLAEGEVYGLVDGGKSIRLDGTPLLDDAGNSNFDGVTWDFRAGTNEQEYIKGFPDVSNETPINVELRSSQPWIKAFTDTQLSAVRIRFKWNSLSKTNPDNGDVTGYKIQYAIDLQTNGGAYVEVLNTKIEDKTSAGYERTHRIDLPKSTTGWQIRVRRITPNDSSQYVQDDMYIDAVAEVIDVKLRYPNTALLGLQYNAETFSSIAKLEVHLRGSIIRVPSNYDSVARTYTGIWDGTFKDAYSNNPAWVYFDLCAQWRYGLGERLDLTMIDKWSLYALGQYCDQMVSDGQGGLEPRFTCNVYLQTQNDAYQVLQNIAGIFRAMSYWNGEQVVLDADVPQDPVYTFSRANVIDGNFEYTGTRARDRHTLAKVAWDNPLNGFETEYEYIRDEKAMAKFGVKVLDLAAFGCTSQAQAQRAGLWALKTEQLETRQVSFGVGLDGFIPQVGNIINVSDELFAGRANGGRVSAVSDAQYVVTVDRDITANVGDVLIVNGADGKSERRNIKTVNGRKLTVTAPFEFAEKENVWAIESPDLKLMRFRVMSITQNDNSTFSITAIQHEPQKYDAIDYGTDVQPTNITIVNPDVVDAPSSVVITSRHRVVQGQTVTTLVIGWAQVKDAVAYDVEWRKDDGSWIKVPRTGNVSVEIEGVYSGNYMARVRSVSAFDVQSQPTTSLLTAVVGKVGLPPTIVGLVATGVLFGMELKWGFGAGSGDAAYTEIETGSAPNTNVKLLGQYSYPTNTHTVTGLQGNLSQSYRARLVDKLGFVSPWSSWVTGTTDASADKVMDLIQGQIDESSLNATLTSKIGKISENEDAISQESQDRVKAIIDANERIDGVIENADVEYYLSSSATTPTGGSWQTTAPVWQQSKYMFSRTKLKGADGNVTYKPSVNGTNITGAKGDKGEQGIQGVSGSNGLEGPKGDQGIQGEKGKDGLSSYTHLAYGTSSTGANFSVNHFASATYIGMYVDNLPTDSTTPSKYKWSLIKGADGTQGIAGAKGSDGLTPYFHVAYATNADGTAGFSTTVSAGKTYIGQYTDNTPADSTTPSKYKWSLIKGDIGQGVDSIVEQYGVSRSESTVPTTWTANSPTVIKGDYVWTRSKITYKNPTEVEYSSPIVSPAWFAISEFNTEFIDFQEDTGSEFEAQGEKLEGIISDYKPRYADASKYANASRSTNWTYWKTVSRDNYAANERITNLQSEVADSNAQLVQRLETEATATSALAREVTTLEATVGENTVSLQETKEVVTGIGGKYSLVIDSGNKVAGYGLINEEGQPTAFDIRADRFSISAPVGKPNDVNGTSPWMVLTTPQVIDGVTVPAGAYARNFYAPRASIDTIQIKDAAIKSAQIDNLAVTSGKIANLAVDTLKIADYAVTVPRVQYTAAEYNFNATETEFEINRLTLNAAGGTVGISFGFERLIATNFGQSTGAKVVIRIRRIGATNPLRTLTFLSQSVPDGSVSAYQSNGNTIYRINYKKEFVYDYISIPVYLDTPPSGDQTYIVTVEGTGQNESYISVSITARTLHLMGVKK